MACYHPMPAVRLANGDVTFVSRTKVDGHAIYLPCGQCVGCRLERSRQWAVRCMHERSMHERACFVTLTYDDEHLPPGKSLNYPDVQKFLRRLRKRVGVPIRFYLCGEYGDDTDRPRYHICLFGFDFPDKALLS